LLWPESKGEKIEVQESKEKRKQKEDRTNGVEEEEEVGGQEEKHRIEDVSQMVTHYL